MSANYIFTVKNLNCVKIGQNSMQTPENSKSLQKFVSRYAPGVIHSIRPLENQGCWFRSLCSHASIWARLLHIGKFHMPSTWNTL